MEVAYTTSLADSLLAFTDRSNALRSHDFLPFRSSKVPLVAVLVHVAGVEVVDALSLDSVFPLVDEKAFIGFYAPKKLRVTVSECRTKVPTKDVRGLLFLLLSVAFLFSYGGYGVCI